MPVAASQVPAQREGVAPGARQSRSAPSGPMCPAGPGSARALYWLVHGRGCGVEQSSPPQPGGGQAARRGSGACVHAPAGLARPFGLGARETDRSVLHAPGTACGAPACAVREAPACAPIGPGPNPERPPTCSARAAADVRGTHAGAAAISRAGLSGLRRGSERQKRLIIEFRAPVTRCCEAAVQAGSPHETWAARAQQQRRERPLPSRRHPVTKDYALRPETLAPRRCPGRTAALINGG